MCDFCFAFRFALLFSRFDHSEKVWNEIGGTSCSQVEHPSVFDLNLRTESALWFRILNLVFFSWLVPRWRTFGIFKKDWSQNIFSFSVEEIVPIWIQEQRSNDLHWMKPSKETAKVACKHIWWLDQFLYTPYRWHEKKANS